MVWVQIVNGLVAGVVAFIWWRSALKALRLELRNAATFMVISAVVNAWYAIAYIALGTGVLELPLSSVIPLFRYAFIVGISTPALAAAVLLGPLSKSVDQWRAGS